MSRRMWTWAIGVLIVLVAVGLVLSAVTQTTDKNYNLIVTTHKARDLVLACQAYRQHPGSGGKHPAKLDDLLDPPFGGGSLLGEGEDPRHALTDPWGNPFMYALVLNEDGVTVPYVWAERTKDGATTPSGRRGRPRGR